MNLRVPVMNASGCWAASKEQLDDLFMSRLGAVVSKTCTLSPKQGNSEPTYYCLGDNVHVNSKGLPNLGYAHYKELYTQFREAGKPFILSVAYSGNLEEITEILTDYDNHVQKQEWVEINMSCPNVEKKICAYNLPMFEDFLRHISTLSLLRLQIGLKLSPYIDFGMCDEIIRILNNYDRWIGYVVLSNSIPNGLVLNNGYPVLSNVYGGISGKWNKHIAIGNVRYFKQHLSPAIKIVGCGGIENARDIQDYMDYGADYVQLGSCFYDSRENVLNISKINAEINQIGK